MGKLFFLIPLRELREALQVSDKILELRLKLPPWILLLCGSSGSSYLPSLYPFLFFSLGRSRYICTATRNSFWIPTHYL